jgi:beta-lactamase class A
MTNRIIVKTKSTKKTKATVASGIIMARTLDELLDVDVSGVKDKYVIVYDSNTRKYTAVNPDEVLSAASNTETTQPGLPNDFVNTLDVDLDDRIDLDAGTF